MVTLLERNFYGVVVWDKKRFKWIKGKYVGTVYSGDPTKTTFGNSLRVFFYSLYSIHLAGITKFFISVAGDDSLF